VSGWRLEYERLRRNGTGFRLGTIEHADECVRSFHQIARGIARDGSVVDVPIVEVLAERAVAAVSLALTWRALVGGADVPPPPDPVVLREVRRVVDGEH
jgi:hypothetical protein